jgi:hypothetical protein
MNGEPEQGPAMRLGDLDVVIAPGREGNGTVAGLWSRTRGTGGC